MRTETKHQPLIIFLLSITSILLISDIQGQGNANFFNIRDGWNSFYNQNSQQMSQTGNGYKDFKRWEYFWVNRTYSADSSQKGNFNLYRNRITDYYIEKEKYDNSTMLAANWRFIGPSGITEQVNGLVNAVYVDTVNDKTLQTIYIGTNTSGIWKTTNGGQQWKNITDQSGLSIIGINNITGDPNNGNILYAATGGFFPLSSDAFGIGIIKSDNKGSTWKVIFPETGSNEIPTHLASYKVLVDPSNSSRIYALVFDKVMRSENYGQTWTRIFTSPKQDLADNDNYRVLRDIEMKPDDNSILYVSTDNRHFSNHPSAQVWKIENATADNPDSIRLDVFLPEFKNCSERFELAVSKADPKALFVLGNDTMVNTSSTIPTIDTRVKIWKSYNNGDDGSWALMLDCDHTAIGGHYSGGGGINYWRMELLVSPTDTGIIYAGGFTMTRLTHWNLNSKLETYGDFTHYHVDTRDAVILKGSMVNQAGNQDVIFAGNDGGLSKSVNGSQSWMNLNGEGLNITQFWGIGSSDVNPYWIGGGTQDNNFFLKDPVTGWLHVGSGDMGNALVNEDDPEIIYSSKWICMGNRIVVSKSEDYGHTWNYGTNAAGTEDWLPDWPLVLDPFDPSTLYIGALNLYKSDNRADSFSQIPVQVNNIPIDNSQRMIAIAISPNNSNIIYIGYALPHWNDSNSAKRYKLLKTTDGGEHWTDLTTTVTNNGYPVFINHGLTDIAISTTNQDSIWISFGGFDAPGKNRVMVSANGGTIWNDYSEGLPDIPVNSIKAWGNGIFISTDVGVFYRSNKQQQWQSFNTGLPIAIVSDIEIVNPLNVIRIATYGRGIWEADLSCNFEEEPRVISQDQTWTDDVTMDRSILITDSSVLTIKSKVKLPPLARIMVRPGSKLIVDGGTLTNACFSMWQGVQVWGNAGQVQGLPFQGCALFIHGALVENARIGVAACRTDENGEIDWRSTGGIIIGDSCTFRNNYEAVKFVSYSRTNSSRFHNVVFETSHDFIDGTSTPIDFVSLFGVRGVTFKGCTFRNTTVRPGSIPSVLKGKGIYSINASYQVDQFEYCPGNISPCSTPLRNPSVFSGLHYGIKALNGDPSYWVNVRRTRFDKNFRGIYLSAVDFAHITQDTLIVPDGAVTADTCYGLYLDHCTAYKV